MKVTGEFEKLASLLMQTHTHTVAFPVFGIDDNSRDSGRNASAASPTATIVIHSLLFISSSFALAGPTAAPAAVAEAARRLRIINF